MAYSALHEYTARRLAESRVREHYGGELYREFQLLGMDMFAVYDPKPHCSLHMRGSRWAVYEGRWHHVRAVEPVTYFDASDIAALEGVIVEVVR
jgi:hypothetical protein